VWWNISARSTHTTPKVIRTSSFYTSKNFSKCIESSSSIPEIVTISLNTNKIFSVIWKYTKINTLKLTKMWWGRWPSYSDSDWSYIILKSLCIKISAKISHFCGYNIEIFPCLTPGFSPILFALQKNFIELCWQALHFLLSIKMTFSYSFYLSYTFIVSLLIFLDILLGFDGKFLLE